jgi:hypothetical protein
MDVKIAKFRTTLFAKSDILEYNPVQGDLMYPERLLMMRNIKNQSVRSDSTQENPSTEEDVNNGRTRISSVSSLVGKSTMSSSPIDHHCLWFPTVRRTVMCLSKLYKCLDVSKNDENSRW